MNDNIKKIIIIVVVVEAVAVLAYLALTRHTNAPTNNVSAEVPGTTNINTNSTGSSLSSTQYLRDINEPSLTSEQVDDLISRLENVDQYQVGTSAALGGLDCGASARHDQLAALNSGERRSWLANNGLLVTATPNTYHWTAADLPSFNADTTVVCGVATTVPQAIVGSWVLWWNTCLSGVGPPQPTDPDYQTSVRCIQAQEALDRHFGLVD